MSSDKQIEYQTFENLIIKEVDYETTKKMMIENHYAKKWNQAFGLVNVGVFNSDKLLGIASFGYSMNPKSWPSITKSDPDKCLELNRLWIDDSLKKNTETWLLSKSWSILREKGYELVQSFSDGRLGVGTIYQAANFSYHGFHETLFHQTSDGVIYHDVQFSNTNRPTGMIKRNLFYARGEVVKTFTVNTYRYLYPLSKSARKKILIPSLPYPKVREGERIIENYSPPPLQVARALLIAKTFFRLDEVETLKNYLDFISDNCSDKYIELAKENIVIQKISDKYADALF
jgi:hypothetical protein